MNCRTRVLKAIVYIEIPVQRWVGKWKVSQNQSEANRQGVSTGLGAMGQGTSASALPTMADLVLCTGANKRT